MKHFKKLIAIICIIFTCLDLIIPIIPIRPKRKIVKFEGHKLDKQHNKATNINRFM